MTDSAPGWGRVLVPYVYALDIMASEIVDDRWGTYDPQDGGTIEQWDAAKQGDYDAERDNMSSALSALVRAGFIILDTEEHDRLEDYASCRICPECKGDGRNRYGDNTCDGCGGDGVLHLDSFYNPPPTQSDEGQR